MKRPELGFLARDLKRGFLKGSAHAPLRRLTMSSIQERLQQLLDGELDPADIADDPTLVSLADRLYGIKIAAVQPVKARDAQDLLGTPSPVTEVAPPTDMLVEVIGSVGAPAPAVPLPLPRLNLTFRLFQVARKIHSLCLPRRSRCGAAEFVRPLFLALQRHVRARYLSGCRTKPG